MNKNTLYRFISVIAAIAVWQIAAMAVDMEMLLASPFDVLKRLSVLVTEKSFLSTILFSTGRILAGFAISLLSGIVLAVAAGRFRAVEYLLWPYIVTFKSVPVASFIILCLIWFSYSQLTVFIAFLISFPVIYSNVLQGIKNADPQLLEMAGSFNLPWHRRFLYVYIPAIRPFLVSSCSVAVGMAWKAGVAAEVIGVVGGSIGERLYNAKIYFSNADLLAWTVVIIVLSIAVEKAVAVLLDAAYRSFVRL